MKTKKAKKKATEWLEPVDEVVPIRAPTKKELARQKKLFDLHKINCPKGMVKLGAKGKKCICGDPKVVSFEMIVPCRKCEEKEDQAMNNRPAMGVSQWRNHGQKYKYWAYFEKQIRADFVAQLQAASKQIHGGGNGRMVLLQLIDKLKKL